MDITPFVPNHKNLITGYGSGGFKINNEWVSGSLIVFVDRRISLKVTQVQQLSEESFHEVLRTIPPIELLLIGTGKNMVSLDPVIRQLCKNNHIAVDAMNTGAACRTYNILLSEERRVAAMLIAL